MASLTGFYWCLFFWHPCCLPAPGTAGSSSPSSPLPDAYLAALPRGGCSAAGKSAAANANGHLAGAGGKQRALPGRRWAARQTAAPLLRTAGKHRPVLPRKCCSLGSFTHWSGESVFLCLAALRKCGQRVPQCCSLLTPRVLFAALASLTLTANGGRRRIWGRSA